MLYVVGRMLACLQDYDASVKFNTSAVSGYKSLQDCRLNFKWVAFAACAFLLSTVQII